MNNVISFSGGKDSTALALLMLERGEPIHSLIHFDGGWEWPEMHDHIDLFEKKTGLVVTRLKPERGFDYWMFERPIPGAWKGHIHRVGNGWPSPMRRWCTREKVKAITAYLRGVDPVMSFIGFAADEAGRVNSKALISSRIPHRFPLIEWGITEKRALEICRGYGFHWGGLYDFLHRVSCFCCPLQGLKSLRLIRKHRPEIWAKILDMDARKPAHNMGFKDYQSAHDLEERFAMEDKQMTFTQFLAWKEAAT